jgi:hypothetical protein
MGNPNDNHDIDIELRQFMRDTAKALTDLAVHVATLTERVSGVSALPDRVTKLEITNAAMQQKFEESEKQVQRKVVLTGIVVAAIVSLGEFVLPFIVKGLALK